MEILVKYILILIAMATLASSAFAHEAEFCSQPRSEGVQLIKASAYGFLNREFSLNDQARFKLHNEIAEVKEQCDQSGGILVECEGRRHVDNTGGRPMVRITVTYSVLVKCEAN
jgi:hypothetical protein